MPAMPAMPAMNRPYFRHYVWDLELEFEKNRTNLAVVRAVRAELQYRRRPRALQLRERIDRYLVTAKAPVRLPAAAPAVVRDVPRPMPKRLPALAAPVRPQSVVELEPKSQPEKRSRVWGQRVAIVAVALVLLGLFIYARATPAKATTAPGAAGIGAVDQIQATVYITRTGTKYHCDGCRSLSKSKIPVKLDDAKKHYGPCNVCRPPQ
jgi:hypothetical protein